MSGDEPTEGELARRFFAKLSAYVVAVLIIGSGMVLTYLITEWSGFDPRSKEGARGERFLQFEGITLSILVTYFAIEQIYRFSRLDDELLKTRLWSRQLGIFYAGLGAVMSAAAAFDQWRDGKTVLAAGSLVMAVLLTGHALRKCLVGPRAPHPEDKRGPPRSS